jgi:tetratricopeptide (TPR) repeat protein
MGDVNLNAQGNLNIGSDVVGRDKIVYEASIPPALSFHQLPPPPRDFTGREDELKELRAALETGGVTISGLHGQGGIGKTALALKLADELKPRYPDAQFYLDLRGAHEQKPLTVAEALAHVIRAYHPTAKLPESEAELSGLYQSVLHGQRALLLMDNARDRAQVEPLVPPDTCCLLVTSRQHFTLPGLHAKNLDQLPPDDARALLIKIAPRLSPPLPAGEGTGVRKNFTDEIARLCGYLPLALRLVASALAERVDLSPADLIRRLNDAQQRLKLTGVDASLQFSYDLLTPEHQTLWRALAVFPADFDRAAADAVWGLEPDPAHDSLSELVRFSLLEFIQPSHPTPLPAGEGWRSWGEGGRYRLHDLSRLFADQRLSDAERHDAHKRHAAHYERVLRAANELYMQGGENILRGLALFDAEQRNIQAGQGWAQAHADDGENVARLCNAYPNAGAYVLNLRLHASEHIRWMEAALAAARKLKDRKAEGAHLGNLGLAYADLGETRRAIEFYEQALLIAREIGNRRSEGNTLGNLGIAYKDLGDVRRAIEYCEQQLVITREIGDRRGEGNALGTLGIAYKNLGAPRRAIEFSEQALIIAREIGDRRGEGAALGSLGNAYAALDETRKAIEFYKQQLVIVHAIGDRRGEANALMNTGNAYAILGDARTASEYHEQALPIYREIGDRRGEGNALFNMSLALDLLGERAQAIAHAEAALKIFEQIESPGAERVRKQLAEWGVSG